MKRLKMIPKELSMKLQAFSLLAVLLLSFPTQALEKWKKKIDQGTFGQWWDVVLELDRSNRHFDRGSLTIEYKDFGWNSTTDAKFVVCEKGERRFKKYPAIIRFNVGRELYEFNTIVECPKLTPQGHIDGYDYKSQAKLVIDSEGHRQIWNTLFPENEFGERWYAMNISLIINPDTNKEEVNDNDGEGYSVVLTPRNRVPDLKGQTGNSRIRANLKTLIREFYEPKQQLVLNYREAYNSGVQPCAYYDAGLGEPDDVYAVFSIPVAGSDRKDILVYKMGVSCGHIDYRIGRGRQIGNAILSIDLDNEPELIDKLFPRDRNGVRSYNLEVAFANSDRVHSPETRWDSNFGKNYHISLQYADL